MKNIFLTLTLVVLIVSFFLLHVDGSQIESKGNKEKDAQSKQNALNKQKTTDKGYTIFQDTIDENLSRNEKSFQDENFNENSNGQRVRQKFGDGLNQQENEFENLFGNEKEKKITKRFNQLDNQQLYSNSNLNWNDNQRYHGNDGNEERNSYSSRLLRPNSYQNELQSNIKSHSNSNSNFQNQQNENEINNRNGESKRSVNDEFFGKDNSYNQFKENGKRNQL
jgi:hypothetical protein